MNLKQKRKAFQQAYDDYMESKYPGYKSRKYEKPKSLADRFIEGLQANRAEEKPIVSQPNRTDPPTLIDRKPPKKGIESAQDVVNRNKNSIAKFAHDALIQDIEDFGQTEFERGIQFAMNMKMIEPIKYYLANPNKKSAI